MLGYSKPILNDFEITNIWTSNWLASWSALNIYAEMLIKINLLAYWLNGLAYKQLAYGADLSTTLGARWVVVR